MKYAEWYVADMETRLEKGGTQTEIDLLVTEINNPTEAGLKAYTVRRDVAYMGAPPCGTCGDMIIARDADPALDKEMLCPSCVKTTSPS